MVFAACREPRRLTLMGRDVTHEEDEEAFVQDSVPWQQVNRKKSQGKKKSKSLSRSLALFFSVMHIC